ncbi:MAG TPA: helix-turn-helix transcriptional regulator [Ktedonobacteraceae bacterium]|nr:helix-turn-helix transcriptional regulator [Ktedonobacteraceae bacterium]
MQQDRKLKQPNNSLRYEREKRGWSQSKLAELIGAPDASTISRWEIGERKPEHSYQEKLCNLFQKDAVELGFIEKPNMLKKLELRRRIMDNESPLPILESSGFFSFGKLETALVVLDGNGIETYSPQNIRSFYDSRPIRFYEEIEQMRETIEKEQAQNEIDGKSFQWNGEIYHLAKYLLSRDPFHEHMKLSLWFHPTDYYTVLAKNRCMKEYTFREKYISGYDWETPFPFLPIPFGVGLSLLTADGYILFAQREGNLGVRPRYFMTSVEEGLSRPLDRGTISDAPDVYRCACRGLFEELGLIENNDFFVSDILFLGLGLDTEYFMCGLRGLIKSPKTAHEIMKNWQIGVKDKMENKKLIAVPFTLEKVCEFVFTHEPWGGGALMGIYHTLVHEFGREAVDRALASYS